MKVLKRLIHPNLFLKLMYLVATLVLVFTMAMGWLYHLNQENLYNGAKERTQRAVETAQSLIDSYVNDSAADTSDPELQAKLVDALSRMRYDGNNYFWISDTKANIIVHPIDPQLNGTDQSGFTDPDGIHVFEACANAVDNPEGYGFVEYRWPKPGKTDPQPKIAFLMKIPGTDWLVGSGMYLDEIKSQIDSAFYQTTTAVVIAITLSLILGLLIARSITNPLKKAINIIAKLGAGEIPEETLSSGTPVNCSQAKNCGKPECPSYNKEDVCWVTAGSFAMVKHCPRALNGEDCRTCDIYGAHNEMDELGSILTSLANVMEEREQAAEAIAMGDLSRTIGLASDQDRLGHALQKMQRNLSDMIGSIEGASQQITSGAAQLADTSQSLSQGATEQAASIEEISASINEMTAQTKTNAENASMANQLTGQTQSSAAQGNAHMQQMIEAMVEINESGKNISKIIKTIDEIAFQTNLLALNAAVEAARAGQHGKGFAVVAEEVRNLAARSAKAAHETTDLIEASVSKAQNGATIAENTAKSLEEIVTGITKISDLVGEIAAASNEQAQGIDQINQGLGQIDLVTQQNTANAEESAAAAEELSGQAEQMRQQLSHFQLLG